MAKFLNERGILVYSTDYRGTGLSEGVRWDIPSAKVWIQDIVNILEHLPDRQVPTFLLGHSLGGALALHSVLDVQPVLQGLIIVAPAMTVETEPLPWSNYLKFPLAMVFAPKLPIVKVPYPSVEDMIRNNADEDLALTLQKEPYRLKRMTARCGLTVNKIRNLDGSKKAASKTTLPVIVACGEGDSAIEGARNYFQSLKSIDKELAIFPKQHHHLLRSQQQTDIFRFICSWIENHLDINQERAGRGSIT